MTLPAHMADHPSPSLVEVGDQVTRVELCLADDPNLDPEGLDGDAFDLGFDLVRPCGC